MKSLNKKYDTRVFVEFGEVVLSHHFMHTFTLVDFQIIRKEKSAASNWHCIRSSQILIIPSIKYIVDYLPNDDKRTTFTKINQKKIEFQYL